MSKLDNRFYTAVSVLAGHGHIKQRLIQAFEDNLTIIEDDDIPVALRQSFVDLRHVMSQVAPLNGEGPICASVRKMSIEEADECAHRILDLYCDMSRPVDKDQETLPPKLDDRPAAAPVLVNTN